MPLDQFQLYPRQIELAAYRHRQATQIAAEVGFEVKKSVVDGPLTQGAAWFTHRASSKHLLAPIRACRRALACSRAVGRSSWRSANQR